VHCHRNSDLIAEPTEAATRVVDALGLELQPCRGAPIPAFAELNRVDRGFFRRGIAGSYSDEMPEDRHELFWSKPENAAAMALIARPVVNEPPD
jgi:hypothetical protein